MKKGKIIKLVLSTLGIALIIGAMITSDIPTTYRSGGFLLVQDK